MSFGWYKRFGGRTPYVGEIVSFRPSDQDLEDLRQIHPGYYSAVRPIADAKRKFEEDTVQDLNKRVKTGEQRAQVLLKRIGQGLDKQKILSQELQEAQHQRDQAEAEKDVLKRKLEQAQAQIIELSRSIQQPESRSGGPSRITSANRPFFAGTQAQQPRKDKDGDGDGIEDDVRWSGRR